MNQVEIFIHRIKLRDISFYQSHLDAKGNKVEIDEISTTDQNLINQEFLTKRRDRHFITVIKESELNKISEIIFNLRDFNELKRAKTEREFNILRTWRYTCESRSNGFYERFQFKDNKVMTTIYLSSTDHKLLPISLNLIFIVLK